MSRNILIVDDSTTTRAMVRRIITLCGTAPDNIYEAADGADGLALLGQNHIDLVLADLHMPNMGGLEMTQRMQSNPAMKNIPVVIISADPNLEHLEPLKQLGVRGHLSKPFTPEGFRNLVGDLLGAQANA